MKIPYEGGCDCGAIRYECSGEPMVTVNCHCRSCQYGSGSSHATGMILAREAFSILQGEPRGYSKRAANGNTVTRNFCPDCGTPLYSESDGNRDIVVVRNSSLDDPSVFPPQMDIFTDDAQPWDCMDPDLAKFPGMPPE